MGYFQKKRHYINIFIKIILILSTIIIYHKRIVSHKFFAFNSIPIKTKSWTQKLKILESNHAITNLFMKYKKAITIRAPDDPRLFLWNMSWPEDSYKEQLIGRKLKMMQLYSPDGIREPVTALEILPETICRFSEFGFCDVSYGNVLSKKAWIKRPVLGKMINIWANNNRLASCKLQPPKNYVLGQILDVSSLLNSTHLTVTGIGKGKGFGGTVARHGFNRGPSSHGSRHHRGPGSIGAGTDPGRVLPGKKMPGRYGNQKCTFHGLKILAINPLRNWLLVRGSVPGNKNSLIFITKTPEKRSKIDKKDT